MGSRSWREALFGHRFWVQGLGFRVGFGFGTESLWFWGLKCWECERCSSGCWFCVGAWVFGYLTVKALFFKSYVTLKVRGLRGQEPRPKPSGTLPTPATLTDLMKYMRRPSCTCAGMASLQNMAPAAPGTEGERAAQQQPKAKHLCT